MWYSIRGTKQVVQISEDNWLAIPNYFNINDNTEYRVDKQASHYAVYNHKARHLLGQTLQDLQHINTRVWSAWVNMRAEGAHFVVFLFKMVRDAGWLLKSWSVHEKSYIACYGLDGKDLFCQSSVRRDWGLEHLHQEQLASINKCLDDVWMLLWKCAVFWSTACCCVQAFKLWLFNM